jgi:hypothetical protein
MNVRVCLMGGSEWESASFKGEFWEGRQNKGGFRGAGKEKLWMILQGT